MPAAIKRLLSSKVYDYCAVITAPRASERERLSRVLYIYAIGTHLYIHIQHMVLHYRRHCIRVRNEHRKNLTLHSVVSNIVHSTGRLLRRPVLSSLPWLRIYARWFNWRRFLPLTLIFLYFSLCFSTVSTNLNEK